MKAVAELLEKLRKRKQISLCLAWDVQDSTKYVILVLSVYT